MRRDSAVCGLAGVLLGTFCMAADIPVEETLRTRWLEAYHMGDPAALGAIYAADARLQHGYCAVVAGRDAIEDFWRSDLAEGTSKTTLEIEDTFNVDDLVYMSGRYDVEIAAGPASPAGRISGTYQQIWRREGASSWTIYRETWTNLACAQGAFGLGESAEDRDEDSPETAI